MLSHDGASNVAWTCGFVRDTWAKGRVLCCLTLVDEGTCECLCIAAASQPTERVTVALKAMMAARAVTLVCARVIPRKSPPPARSAFVPYDRPVKPRHEDVVRRASPHVPASHAIGGAEEPVRVGHQFGADAQS